MNFKPVRANRTFEEVVNQISSLIERGELKVGDRLPSERELSKQLTVSRNTLREGLRTLEQAGVVQLKKGKTGGAFITSPANTSRIDGVGEMFRIGDMSLGDLSDARLWLVELVVRVACERATEADLSALEENVHEAKRLYQKELLAEKADKNLQFYELLAAATRNPLLSAIMKLLLDGVRAFARRVGPERSTETFRLRMQFLQALRARAADAAVAVMQKNLRRTHREYIRVARSGHGSEHKPTTG